MSAKSPSEKIQVVGLGDLLSPAACIVCGNGTCQDGYISFGIFVDYVGSLYLCMTCMLQAAETADCSGPVETEMNRTLLAQLKEENSTLRKDKETLNERLRVFSDALAGIRDDQPRVISDYVVPSDIVDEAPDSLISNGEAGESEPAEPVKVEGRSKSQRASVRNSGGPISI